MKKTDKMPQVSHREYLDMDSEEEELGRQESPEPDEELPPEPEKPVFSERDFEILIQYIKDLIIFQPKNKLIFSENSIETIKEYFSNPNHLILILFYCDTEYKATLNFPTDSIDNLTYILRLQWQIYTPDNFMSSVLFGNCSENSILKFMMNIYSPTAFFHNNWTPVKRGQVFSNLNKFLLNLTEITYFQMDFPMLYIPFDGIQFCNGEKNLNLMKENNKLNYFDDETNGAIERLERVARIWMKKIRGELKNINMPRQSLCRTITDEIHYWNYRFDNLNCLYQQVTNEYLITIINTLEGVKSSSVKQFYKFIEDLKYLLTETSSNITYLNLLTEYCNPTDNNNIIDYITDLLLLIQFIGSESQFYNSKEQIEILCKCVGTQIILQCKKYIDLNIILQEDPNNGKTMLNNGLNCCKKFIEIFNEIKNSDPKVFFNVNESNIFYHVKIFIQRCEDLIEIVDSRIVFDKFNDKTLKHQENYEKIEDLFSKMLDEIKEAHENVFDVTDTTWLIKIQNYRNKIESVDNMMKNLLDDIFNRVENVAEGLEALYSVKRFLLRKSLKQRLYNFLLNIWKLFECELEKIIIYFDHQLQSCDLSLTYCTRMATLSQINSNYLSSQFNKLINGSDWFDDCVGQNIIIEKYKKVQKILLEKKNKFLSIREMKSISTQPVLKSCDDIEFIEANIK